MVHPNMLRTIRQSKLVKYNTTSSSRQDAGMAGCDCSGPQAIRAARFRLVNPVPGLRWREMPHRDCRMVLTLGWALGTLSSVQRRLAGQSCYCGTVPVQRGEG